MVLSDTLARDIAPPSRPDLDGPPDVPTPALGTVDAVYQRGFEAVFGDRWEAAYDRVVAIAQHEGPVEAARAVQRPGDLVPGLEASDASATLAQALHVEAERLPRDARVTVQDGPGEDDGVVTIASTIYIYGDGATDDVAYTFERGIAQAWKWGRDGLPWTHTSGTGETYKVAFDVDVQVYDPDDPSRGPGLFSGRLNPFNRDNFIRVDADVERSRVWLGDNGHWRSEGRDGWTLAEDNPAPHEFGHLLGLRDRYHHDDAPREGWEGNLMATPDGRVEQRDIDRIVGPHVERFERAALPAGEARHSSIAPLF